MPTVENVCRTDPGLAASLRVSVARLHRRLRMAHAGEIGVSPSGVAVLALLSREGERTIGQLAAAEQVRPPSMTRTVSTLESQGLVERRAHPSDRRQVVITLTTVGQELLVAERRRRDAWLAQRLRELTPDERAALRTAAPILERLSNS